MAFFCYAFYLSLTGGPDGNGGGQPDENDGGPVSFDPVYIQNV